MVLIGRGHGTYQSIGHFNGLMESSDRANELLKRWPSQNKPIGLTRPNPYSYRADGDGVMHVYENGVHVGIVKPPITKSRAGPCREYGQ